MLVKLLTKVFGSRNDRTLRRMRKVVEQINRMEPDMEKLSDDELKAKTNEFRARPGERRVAGKPDPGSLRRGA